MTVSLAIHSLDDAQPFTGPMMVLGRRTALFSEALRTHLPSPLVEMLPAMLEEKTGGDAGEAVSTWLSASQGPCVVGLLPEPCSRHNTPARSYAIADLVRDHAPKTAELDIVLALDEAEHAIAAASAVARALPLYNRKTASKAKAERHVRVWLSSCAPEHCKRIAEICDGIRNAARWVDMPTNELHIDAVLREAQNMADTMNIKRTVIQGEALISAGMGGLYGVGRAAKQPPAMLILSHTPSGASKTVVWVGKGIVYDTGGLSLKSSQHMVGMKADMGGAAAVLGAFQAAVKLNVPFNLHAILCLAENAIGPDATRPDDVLQLLSGKTVEINNTDAEGRLVLADGLAYATQNLKPDVIADVATLTGAQMVATGKRHAAIVSNDEALEQQALKAGRRSGDLVHALPYCPEFFRAEFKSDVADMRNSVKDRANAQSSCAGQFLAEHLADANTPWLHIDIAGPSGMSGRGTGFGVGLLMELFASE